MGTPGSTREDTARTSTQDPANYARQAAPRKRICAIITAVNALKAVETAVHAANGAKTFALRPTADTLADLSRPIDPRHLKTRKQGTATLTYCPWNTIARHLHHRAPGWCWEVQSVQEVGGSVVVTGRLTIPTADGDLLHYSAVASEPLESASKAPAAEVAASCCLRRAAALAGLGLELWG
jgi:hypothetical protein